MVKVLLLIIVLNVSFVFSKSNEIEIMKNLEELQSVIDNSVFSKKTPWKTLGFKEKPDDMKFIIRLNKLLRISNPENWIKVQVELSSTEILEKILMNSYKVLRTIKDNYKNSKNVNIDSFFNLNMSFEIEDKIIISFEDDLAKYFVEYDLSKNILSSYPSVHGLISMVPFESTTRYKGFIKLLEFENFGGRSYQTPYIKSIENHVSQMRGKKVVDISNEKISLINERAQKAMVYFNDLWPNADKRIYFYSSSDTLEELSSRPTLFKEILLDSFSSNKCGGIFNKLY